MRKTYYSLIAVVRVSRNISASSLPFRKPTSPTRASIGYLIREGHLKPSAHSLFSLRRIDFDSIVAASTAWENEKNLLLTWRFVETVHGDQLTCKFDENTLTL